MNKHDEQFQPELIEEQIDALTRTEHSTNPTARMVEDLRHIYIDYEGAGARVWERLARHVANETEVVHMTDLDDVTAREGNNPLADQQARRNKDGSSVKLLKSVAPPALSSRRTIPSWLATIAAMLVVGILVSTLLLVLQMTRTNQSGSTSLSTDHGIYLFEKDGIEKLDLQTHKVLWHVTRKYHGFADDLSPVLGPKAYVLGNNLYMFDEVDKITALNTQNGQVRWSRNLTMNGWLSIRPVLLNGSLYIIGDSFGGFSNSSEPLAYVLDPASGSIRTNYEPSKRPFSMSSIDGDMLSYSTFEKQAGTVVYALRLSDGKLLWRMPLVGPKNTFELGPLSVKGGVVYMTFRSKDTKHPTPDLFYAFEGKTGKVLWKQALSGSNSGVRESSLIGDTLYYTNFNGNVYALNAQTGKQVWQKPYNGLFAKTAPDVLYMHAVKGNDSSLPYLVALSAKDGRVLWQTSIPGYYFGAVSSSLVNLDGVLYDVAFSHSIVGGKVPGAISAIRASDGKLLWKLPVKDGVILA
ncbi:PQQ-like beta-propeller repeat protein [Ktedonobacter racemifer]|uniref:Pyrrolo-quinoline quinone n=1 Tax=Ktedonobacter racemifer DSM 44963 TaxID=485913 RepID=D6TLI3_KTERA|nr:PQQ-like beta-propeller repeat protein [Ktedonobacter racemifer]EFH86633.1 Pyrrolo-quinoline quinone [Ktedonobacter racemifer DSM 44963]